MKKLGKIFLISLFLNFIWENLHVFLYDNYMGGKITELVLLRASLIDGIIISIISLPFIYISFLKDKEWLILPIGFIWAVIMEWMALASNRWAYNYMMPIVPFLAVGFTPMIQLGVLGFISFKIIVKK